MNTQTKEVGKMNPTDLKAGKLPLAFVMWLTIRSQFLDKLIAKDPNLSSEWNQFEVEKLEELKAQVNENPQELFAHGGND